MTHVLTHTIAIGLCAAVRHSWRRGTLLLGLCTHRHLFNRRWQRRDFLTWAHGFRLRFCLWILQMEQVGLDLSEAHTCCRQRSQRNNIFILNFGSFWYSTENVHYIETIWNWQAWRLVIVMLRTLQAPHKAHRTVSVYYRSMLQMMSCCMISYAPIKLLSLGVTRCC